MSSLSTQSSTRFRRDALASPELLRGVGLSDLETRRALIRWSAAPLLSLLSPLSVVQLLGALLVESKVVVMGADMSEEVITAAVLAMSTLVHPLQWQGVVLPLVPQRLQQYTEVCGGTFAGSTWRHFASLGCLCPRPRSLSYWGCRPLPSARQTRRAWTTVWWWT